jgi:Ca-activated chloride channel family protein
MRRVFPTLAFVVTMCLVTAVLSAQIRVDVQLINVFATVTDNAGRYVSTLTQSDFILEEDGVPQNIAHFTQDRDTAVSVGIVLDTSGSMERKIRTATSAVERFARSISREDEVFLITFSGEPVLRQDFTSDRRKLTDALRRLRVTGGTALYDAVNEALVKMRQGNHDKRAILVITDGQDTASLMRGSEANQAVRESEYLVYALGISPMTYSQNADHIPFSWPLPTVRNGRGQLGTQRDAVDMDVLNAFAENSGGRAFLLNESLIGGRESEIDKVLDEVAAELRSQYTLGYYPAHPDDGRFHSIKVVSKSGHTVRARKGYLSPGS